MDTATYSLKQQAVMRDIALSDERKIFFGSLPTHRFQFTLFLKSDKQKIPYFRLLRRLYLHPITDW